MKIGIISDIHGNIEALNAVLKELEEKNIDKIICLGDMISGAIHSEEVLKTIMNLKEKIVVVRGNHEGYIVDGVPEFVHDERIKVTQNERDRVNWIKNNLSKETLEYISNLPKDRYLEIGEKKIYIVHYPMKEDGAFKKFAYNANIEEDEELFSGIDADIYLYGHTHKWLYNEKEGKKYINPGSLGCTEEANAAPYGILEITESNIEYEQCYANYDYKKVIEEIKELKFPSYELVLRIFFKVEV